MLELMSLDQIKEKAGSAFAETRHSRTSQKYQHVPTMQVIDHMLSKGWGVRTAGEMKLSSKVLQKNPTFQGHQIHTLVFHNPESPLSIRGLFPEIVLRNNSMGIGAFKLSAGLYRFVCGNGLIIPSEEFFSSKINHIGEHVQEKLNFVISKTLEILSQIPFDIYNKEISKEVAKRFVKEALALRFPKQTINAIDVEAVLLPIREEDSRPTLWNTFNVVQERTVKGGVEINREKIENSKRKSVQKSRSLSLASSIDYNEDLWSLMNKYAKEIA